MQELTAFQYDVLASVYDLGAAKGLSIKADLEETHDKYDGEVNHGRLFPNLDKLADAGYVNKSVRDGRTNEYTLTGAGVDVLFERIDTLGRGWDE